MKYSYLLSSVYSSDTLEGQPTSAIKNRDRITIKIFKATEGYVQGVSETWTQFALHHKYGLGPYFEIPCISP